MDKITRVHFRLFLPFDIVKKVQKAKEESSDTITFGNKFINILSETGE